MTSRAERLEKIGSVIAEAERRGDTPAVVAALEDVADIVIEDLEEAEANGDTATVDRINLWLDAIETWNGLPPELRELAGRPTP